MAIDIVAETDAYPEPGLRARQGTRIEEGLAAEESAGRLLALKGRTAALIVIAVFLLILAPFPDVIFYELFLALFIVAGFGRQGLERIGLYRWWQSYVQIAADFALLAFILVVPNPLATVHPPIQMGLRFGNFAYFYVLLVGLAFSYRPKLVIWGGVAGAVAWGIAVAWVSMQPDTILTLPMDLTVNSLVLRASIPTFVDLDIPIRDIVVFLITAALLATVVARSRDLVKRQASLERERGNLARYFPPATVDRLARQDAALAQVREQDIAVLFCDLVGFTHWAERHAPHEVIGLLREVHARLEEEVFRHHGTLDKFIGDGLMATFGTPEPGPCDAVNAVNCLKSIVTDFDAWNERRKTRNKAPIQIAVGLHYGPVVVGNIGTDRRLEFAVLGDTVNVASRLEALTRELRAAAAISGAIAEAARNEVPAEADEILAGFIYRGPVTLRGRDHQVEVLTFGERA
jgi:adenylate cyclase